jgi:hypothetical protein
LEVATNKKSWHLMLQHYFVANKKLLKKTKQE